MFGASLQNEETKGIIPRACTHIFNHIAGVTDGTEFTIKCSFLEIYKENVRDLLNPKNSNLKVRETPQRGVWVENLTELVRFLCSSPSCICSENRDVRFIYCSSFSD
jgi:hypothetical protein